MKTKLNGNGHKPNALPVPDVIESLESFLGQLLIGDSLLLLPARGWALALPAGGGEPALHTDLSPARLPFRDLAFDTVAVHLPANYPEEAARDLLAEVARIASHRIVCAGRVVPVDLQLYFQTNQAFRLVSPHVLQLTDLLLEIMILSVFEVQS